MLNTKAQALERGALFNHLNNLSSLLEAMIADSDVLDARTTSRTHALEEALQCRKITALEVVEAVERHACETAELLVADKQRAEKICKRTQIRPGGVLDPAVWCGGDRIGEHGGLLEGLKTQSKVRVSEEVAEDHEFEFSRELVEREAVRLRRRLVWMKARGVTRGELLQ
jgi:hypothetical protein